MPALNEESFIADAINSILPRSRWLDYELLVADGGSTDATRSIVEFMSAANPRIKLIDNPKRLQSAGVNLAARSACPRARYIVRADCHAVYPPKFVDSCVEALIRHRASSVVVPMRAAGLTPMQRAIAIAQNCRLGNGGAVHRRGCRPGFVDHGHHAAFDRAMFQSIGGYDEDFACNEDAELDVRLHKAGGRIWMAADTPIIYYPRSRCGALARQYLRYGVGRAHTLVKHASRPALRQIVPPGLVIASMATLAAAPFDARGLFLPGAYASFCLVWGLAIAIRTRAPEAALSGIAALIMHLSWGAGFLRGLPMAWRARAKLKATSAPDAQSGPAPVSSLQ